MAGAPRAVPGALSWRPCGWETAPTFTLEHRVPVSPFGPCSHSTGSHHSLGSAGRSEDEETFISGQRCSAGPEGPLAGPVPCRTSLSIPAGRILVSCTGSVHVECEAIRAAESKQLHQPQGEGWFEDEVVASSRPALDLHHVWNVRGTGLGQVEMLGVQKEGGAEARANSFSSSVSFLCRQE